MIKYPKVEHKLPEVFQEIIKNDTRREEIRSSSTPSFQDFKDLKIDRQNLRLGAENFIVKQKGGTPNASR
jgi:hypothetical protein